MSTTPHSDVDAWLDGLDLRRSKMRDGAHLREIAAARVRADQADLELVEAIRAARSAGDSWDAIGAVLGTSRQAAHRKFASLVATADTGN